MHNNLPNAAPDYMHLDRPSRATHKNTHLPAILRPSQQLAALAPPVTFNRVPSPC